MTRRSWDANIVYMPWRNPLFTIIMHNRYITSDSLFLSFLFEKWTLKKIWCIRFNTPKKNIFYITRDAIES